MTKLKLIPAVRHFKVIATVKQIRELIFFGNTLRKASKSTTKSTNEYSDYTQDMNDCQDNIENNSKNFCAEQVSPKGQTTNNNYKTITKDKDNMSKPNSKNTVVFTPEQKQYLTEIKEKINRVIGASITIVRIYEIVNKNGIKRIEYMLDAWNKFKQQSMKSISGFFIGGCLSEVPYEIKTNNCKDARLGRDHYEWERKYSDDYYESCYS